MFLESKEGVRFPITVSHCKVLGTEGRPLQEQQELLIAKLLSSPNICILKKNDIKYNLIYSALLLFTKE